VTFGVALAQTTLALEWDARAPLWDKAVHFAAALGVAIAFCDRPHAKRVAIAMSLGLAWEVAQGLYEIRSALSMPHVVDTVGDVIADLCGAVALSVRAGHPTVDDALHV
jgi:hypothetical protein